MRTGQRRGGIPGLRPSPGFARQSTLGRSHSGLTCLLLVLLLLWPSLSRGYSVLTHEEVVDLLWKDELRPLLLKRYPGASREQLRHAHAYAYGGSLVQDIGYYPFGSHFFSDLTHYVRTGDFVMNLLRNSEDIDDYAFALGALAHYVSDIEGHPAAVNRAVALGFPRLRAKYGDLVTYEDDPKAHIRVEFGFDLVQVAKDRFTSDNYHDFIGFEVAEPLLEEAFFQTYGLHLEEVIGHVDLAIGTFRRAVSQIIPEMTRAALVWKRLDLVKETPNFNARKFRYYLSRAQYEREWGRDYRRPTFVERLLALCLRWVPKIGPLKAMAFKIPTTQTEDMYIHSLDLTTETYRRLLEQLGHGELRLPNLDLDTGRSPRVGEYELTDETYVRLMREHAERHFTRMTPQLRANIIRFYRNLDVPVPTHRQEKAWRRGLIELSRLKAATSR
jgi:Zinc dependent phospholipase C